MALKAPWASRMHSIRSSRRWEHLLNAILPFLEEQVGSDRMLMEEPYSPKTWSRISEDGSRSNSRERRESEELWRSHFRKSVAGEFWKFILSDSSENGSGSGAGEGREGGFPLKESTLSEGQMLRSRTSDSELSDQLVKSSEAMEGPDLSVDRVAKSNDEASRRMRSASGVPITSSPGAPLPNNESDSSERFGQSVTACANED